MSKLKWIHPKDTMIQKKYDKPQQPDKRKTLLHPHPQDLPPNSFKCSHKLTLSSANFYPSTNSQPPAWKQQSSTGPECWYCNRMLLFTTSNSRTLLSHDATRRNCDDDGPNLTLCIQSFGVFLSRNSMRDSLIFLKCNEQNYQQWVRIDNYMWT